MSYPTSAEKHLTIFSLTADEIEELLQLSNDPARNELASQLKALATPEAKIRLLESDRRFLRTVFEAARFSHFAIEKVATDKDFDLSDDPNPMIVLLVARFGHIDRSHSPVTPTDKIDCRHFHALSGRKRAAYLVSCRPMLFEGRRIDEPHREMRFWLDTTGCRNGKNGMNPV